MEPRCRGHRTKITSSSIVDCINQDVLESTLTVTLKFIYEKLPGDGAFMTAQVVGNEVVCIFDRVSQS
jgi:hypothetical protein